MPEPIIPEYKYGTTTDYSAWTANTQITLCNVPWNADYRDIVKWADRGAANAYIDSLPNRVTKTSTYARIDAPIKIDTPFAVANKYNYLRVVNPASHISSDEPTHFYYFITAVQFNAPQTTLIRVQLDVWTTFGFSVKFGRCYIERGHIGIAATNAFDSFGLTYLSEPEGLDTGSEYQTAVVRKNLVMDTQGTLTGTDSDKPMVMVLSAIKIDMTGAGGGTVAEPEIEIADPANHAGIPVGLGMYLFQDLQSFANMVWNNREKPWILDGIKSVTVIPHVARYGITMALTSVSGTDIRTVNYASMNGSQRPQTRRIPLWNNWRDAIEPFIPARYRHLKKLKTYPYMGIEATTWNGSALTLRPEMWNDANATFAERVSLLPPAQRVVLSALKYAAQNPTFYDAQGDDWGQHIGASVVIDQFPTVPVLNDAATLTLAQNARGMAFQQSQADWAQQRTQAGIATSYDQASNAMGVAQAQTDLSNRSNRQTTDVNNQFRALTAMTGAAQGIAMGGAGGAMAGGPVGAGVGLATGAAAGGASMLGAAMSSAQASQLTGMQAATASEATRINIQSMGYVRDSNRDLAEFTARGDYAQAIAGMQASVQDTMMTPPSIVGSFGGDMFRLINNMMELNVRWKMISLAAMKRVGEYWLRYGYALNLFAVVPDSLMVMSKFTYWKLSETYVKSADMPESYKHAIRGIFEKGVTVWAEPAFIGNTDYADNAPLEGITL